MLNNDLSQMNFKFLEGVQGALHLDLTHNGKAADKEAMYLKTNQFHVAQFAYLIAADEGDRRGRGTLLDNSILMLRLEPVRRRRARRRPDADPARRQGRRDAQARPRARLPDKGDDNRQACSLYLSLMDRMGVKLDRFGDAQTRLEDLYC